MIRLAALTKAALDATTVSADDEVVRYGDHIERHLEAWSAVALEERHQLLSIMLDGVYVDMVQGLVLGLKPKPEFLPLFNLGEPVTTGDSELVTGGWSRVELHLKHGLVVLVEGRNSPVDSMTGFITTQPTDAPEMKRIRC